MDINDLKQTMGCFSTECFYTATIARVNSRLADESKNCKLVFRKRNAFKNNTFPNIYAVQ